MATLVSGSIDRILKDELNFHPILQITNVKGLTAAGNAVVQRYRLILSDGTKTISAMLATSKNDLVLSKQIGMNTLIRLDEFITNVLQAQKIVILMNCTPVGVGVPQAGSNSSPPGGAPVAAQPQPQHGQYGAQGGNGNGNAAYGAGAAPSAGGPYGQQQQQQQQQKYQQQQPAPNIYPSNGQPYQQQQQPAYGQGQGQGGGYGQQGGYGQGQGQGQGQGGYAQPQGMPHQHHQQQQAPMSYGQPPPQQQQSAGMYGQPSHTVPVQQQQGQGGQYGQPQGNNQGDGQYGRPVPTAGQYGGAYNSAPVVRDASSSDVCPISALNPYATKWTIKARVTVKTDIRKWANERGEGQLFSVDLLDDQKGELRATFFKDAVDKFYPLLEEGKAYFFSGGKVKIANAKFTKCDFEVTFDTNSVIRPCSDEESSSISSQVYNFTSIAYLPQQQDRTVVDVLGIVKHDSGPSDLTSKAGKDLTKRTLTLIDSSGHEIAATLWGEKAKSEVYGWQENPIIAIKGGKTSEFQGCSLNISDQFTVNPDIPEAHALHNWRMTNDWKGTGVSVTASNGFGVSAIEPLEKRMTMDAVKDQGFARSNGDKGGVATVQCAIMNVNQERDPFYEACPNCRKRVIPGMSGDYRCEKCQADVQAERRYILTCMLADHTGSQWVTLFNDECVELLGMTADELHGIRLNHGDDAYLAVIKKPLFTSWNCVIKSKLEMVQDEHKLNSTVGRLGRLNYVDENIMLINAIQKYDA